MARHNSVNPKLYDDQASIVLIADAIDWLYRDEQRDGKFDPTVRQNEYDYKGCLSYFINSSINWHKNELNITKHRQQ